LNKKKLRLWVSESLSKKQTVMVPTYLGLLKTTLVYSCWCLEQCLAHSELKINVTVIILKCSSMVIPPWKHPISSRLKCLIQEKNKIEGIKNLMLVLLNDLQLNSKRDIFSYKTRK
jgi:hypothetical protein